MSDEVVMTAYRYATVAGGYGDYMSRADALARLRQDAERQINDGQRLLAALDANEVAINWVTLP